MNFNSMLDSILQKIGQWTDTAIRARALEELVLVQHEMELAPELPWFLWQEEAVVVTGGTASTALPGDFLRLDRDYSYIRLTHEDSTRFLSPLSVELFQEYSVGRDVGNTPLVYAISGFNLLTAPVVATNVTLYVQAAWADTVPTDAAATNLWATHAPNVLIYHTASRLASDHLQDFQLADMLEQRFRASWDVVKRASIARKIEHLDFAKGDD